MDTIQSLDGITGPDGQCNCSHCQMDAVIDGIMAPADQAIVDQTPNREATNVQSSVPVVTQLAY